MKIWAHRGCSQNYPENTLLAFEKAAGLDGLTGIELDIQMTKDGYMVVCHDERVDRTTDGIGEIQNFTLSELKKLKIHAEGNKSERIPTIDEALDLLEGRLKEGLELNIELKNSNIPYEGMEEKILEKIEKRGLERQVVYSSFYAHSIERIRKLGMDLLKEKVKGYPVRAWFSGHLYPEKPTGGRLDLGMLEEQGITDVIINEPEKYL